MFGKRFKLFSLLGFEVSIDLSWIVIALLIVWSLATGVFPHYHPELSTAAHWVMGVVGAAGLFLSIILHELCHSLVARHYGLPMKGITLFIFGGVAEMHDNPPSPKAEALMALAGPAASLGIGAMSYLFVVLGERVGWATLGVGVLRYVALINFVLLAFNLVPAFPLDGGRVLRAGLWAWRKNITWATRVSSAFGSGFGYFLIFMGIFAFITGAFVAGLWWCLIGLFLKNASQLSYRQLIVSRNLDGEPVDRIMQKNPASVPENTTIDHLVHDYIYRYHFQVFPVVSDGKPPRYVGVREVKGVPRDEWRAHSASEIAKPCDREDCLSVHDDASTALEKMRSTGNSRLLVLDDDNQLVGVITLKDLLEFLSVKMDLGDDGDINKLKDQVGV